MDSIRIFKGNNSIELCADPYQIIVNEQYKIPLTIIEGKLLSLLLTHRTVTRQFCVEQLWEGRVISDPDKSLTQVISTLRKKLDQVAITKIIITTPRVGYRVSSQWTTTKTNTLPKEALQNEDFEEKESKSLPHTKLKNLSILISFVCLASLQLLFFAHYFSPLDNTHAPYSLIYLNEETQTHYTTSPWGSDFFDDSPKKLSFSINNYRVYLSCRDNNKRINVSYSINTFINKQQNKNNLLEYCSYGS